jgi:1-acyl-sn-glycerol-3-phosphate acyltransferase
LWWLRITCGLKFVVKGRENIPVGASVIMAKHQSAWETLALQQIFPPQVWVLKRELLRIPFFGWGLALLSPIAIDRAAAKEALNQLVQQGKSRLQQGFWVVIFPEGTRVPFGNRGKYRAGGAWLATQAQVPVVPVAHNAGAFWARNAFLKYPGTITVSIGQALHSTDYDHNPARLVRAAEAWIEAECESLGGRV